MFLSIGMLKLNYFLADIFILSAEKQPIKLSWRKIECLRVKIDLFNFYTRFLLSPVFLFQLQLEKLYDYIRENLIANLYIFLQRNGHDEYILQVHSGKTRHEQSEEQSTNP